MSTRFASLTLACLVLGGCAVAPHSRVVSTPEPASRPTPRPQPAPGHVACADCGRIERIERVSAIRATASGGAVLGGIVGGVVSAPQRSAAATAPNAGSPSHAAQPQQAYRIALRMDDGRHMVVHQNLIADGVAVGSRVRLVQGRLVPVH